MLSINTAMQKNLVSQLSILFVEDDADVRENMERYLKRRVARVYTAENGVEGLNSFMAQRPDLVISDIRMGEMDGLSMCRTIRKENPDFPVILISAHNESEILLSSIDLGVTKFIVKPVDTNVLMDTISGVAESLGQRRNLENRFQQMNLILHETDYETECVRGYVSRYLDANHHDEISNVRHLNIPKLSVSGDFYSVAKHQDDLYVMLADGAGHGLSAVLPALQLPKIFQQQAMRGFSLLTIATEMNRSLYEQHFTEHFVASTLIRINANEHIIEVLNCGNPPVLIFDELGVLLHTCDSRTTALGMVGDEEFSVNAERLTLDKSARIYLFTDGLFDTLRAISEDFNDTELQRLLAKVRSQNEFDDLAKNIREAAQSCRVDDVTLLEIRFDCDATVIPKVEILHEMESKIEAEPPVALDQMTMMYVEDDDVTRDYLGLYLNRRLGIVHLAKNGKEGLELFKKHRPQIVLSDIKMPLMSGLAMAEEIRKLDKQVPIIVTSGSDNAEDAEKMFEMGISRFHMKPLDPGKLTDTINSCVRQSNALNQLRLSASAFQASSLAVIYADKDKRIVSVNPAFSRITGYVLAEVAGHSPTLLSSGRHEASHYQAMWRALDETGNWSGELLCQHKNGAPASEWVTVNALTGADGEVTGYQFIFSDITERQVNEEKLRQLAEHDSLTRLPNRVLFEYRINELLTSPRPVAVNMALVYINIDRFFEINNLHGVRVGDEVLFAIAQRLMANIGASDVLCRMGGDEFAIFILRDGDHELIERTVMELLEVIKRPVDVHGSEIQLRASVGIGMYPPDGGSYEELVKSASNAMIQAQCAGGDTYRFFDKSISQHEERLITLQQSIKRGLQNEEFYMLYQPKYSLSQQRVVGAEALVRWRHPTLGLISPVEFIPLAESSGSVIELSEWIIDTVCAQIAEWRGLGRVQVPVSINISPVHFWRGNLVMALQSALQKWDIHPAMLPIEVTEGVVMDTSEKTLQVLGALKALGFHLSIDDFGTGYSSLKYLKDLPISELKIDRSFIIQIPEEGQPGERSKTAIARAIIQLASELNLTVVAEGVETENQKKFLLENGCDVIQGYLFSRPIGAPEFAVLMS